MAETSWLKGLKESHSAIVAVGKAADNLAKGGNRKAMRLAIACESDANVLKRVIERAEKDFYDPKKCESK